MLNKSAKLIHKVARRKSSVAKCWLTANGSGQISVNGLPVDKYFFCQHSVKAICEPLDLAFTFASRYNIICRPSGGGFTGQAESCRRAIAIALTELHPELRSIFKPLGLLRSDTRKVEPKRYGHRKSRKKVQFSKR